MKQSNIKMEKKGEIAMVECPSCNRVIETPAKFDIIFECPHCHKELITFDKHKEQLQKQYNNNMKQKMQESIKQKKQLLIWGCIITFLCLFVYTSIIDKPDMHAIYIITKDYDAAINVEVEKALVKAAVDGDRMKTLEIIGNKQTIHFYQGDQVKITRDVVRGFPDHYRVERLSDGASALIPVKYLVKK